MSDLRILGVAAQLVVALFLVGVGAAAIGRRVRPGRAWDMAWGRTPGRADGAALAVLGLGVGAWALTQTADLVPLTLQLAAIAVVGVGAVAVVGVQSRIPDDPGIGEAALDGPGPDATAPGEPTTGGSAPRTSPAP